MTAPAERPLPFSARVIRALQPLWLRAVEAAPPRPVYELLDPLPPPDTLKGGVIACVPTYIGTDPALVRASIQAWFDQLSEAAAAVDFPIGAVMTVQYRDPEKRQQAADWAHELSQLKSHHLKCSLALIMLDASKSENMNAAAEVGAQLGAAALHSVDDDVYIEPHGLVTLLSAFGTDSSGQYNSYGLAGLLAPARGSLSRVLTDRRDVKQAPRHPFGCNMIARLDRGGFPIPRHLTDDVWIASRTLDPKARDPFHVFCMILEPKVHYIFKTSYGSWFKRAWRVHVGTYEAGARIPPENFVPYVRYAVFGMPVWRGNRATFGRGEWTWRKYLLAHAMRLVYITIFWLTGLSLTIRGLCGRPVQRPGWTPPEAYLRPGGESPTA